jgi:hypothetical protein
VGLYSALNAKINVTTIISKILMSYKKKIQSLHSRGSGDMWKSERRRDKGFTDDQASPYAVSGADTFCRVNIGYMVLSGKSR